jgi:hypothetical protein
VPAVGIHSDGRAAILDDPYEDAPPLEDGRLLARLSLATRVVLFQLSERVNCGFFQVGCWVDGAMAWQITHCREEPETEEYQILGVPPGIFADKAAPYRAQQAQADAAGEDTCANHRPESLSHRSCSRRQQLNHDSDRSTRQRWRPSRVDDSIPRRAIPT